MKGAVGSRQSAVGKTLRLYPRATSRTAALAVSPAPAP